MYSRLNSKLLVYVFGQTVLYNNSISLVIMSLVIIMLVPCAGVVRNKICFHFSQMTSLALSSPSIDDKGASALIDCLHKLMEKQRYWRIVSFQRAKTLETTEQNSMTSSIVDLEKEELTK